MRQETILERRNFLASVHDNCMYGRIAAVYIFRKGKWVKIGEYCKGCGELKLFPKFEKGLE